MDSTHSSHETLPESHDYNLRNRNDLNPPLDSQLNLEDAQRAKISNLKRQRAGKKSSITRRIKTVHNIILEKGSRTKLKAHIKELYATLSSASIIHETLMNLLSEKDPDFSDEWIAELNENIDKCNAEVLDYMVERGDDTDSIISCISSDSQILSESDFELSTPIKPDFEPRVSEMSEKFSSMYLHDSNMSQSVEFVQNVSDPFDNRFSSNPNVNTNQIILSKTNLPDSNLSIRSNPERVTANFFDMRRSHSAPIIDDINIDSVPNDYISMNAFPHPNVTFQHRNIDNVSNKSGTSSNVSAHLSGSCPIRNDLSSVHQVVSNSPYHNQTAAPVPTQSYHSHSVPQIISHSSLVNPNTPVSAYRYEPNAVYGVTTQSSNVTENSAPVSSYRSRPDSVHVVSHSPYKQETTLPIYSYGQNPNHVHNAIAQSSHIAENAALASTYRHVSIPVQSPHMHQATVSTSSYRSNSNSIHHDPSQSSKISEFAAPVPTKFADHNMACQLSYEINAPRFASNFVHSTNTQSPYITDPSTNFPATRYSNFAIAPRLSRIPESIVSGPTQHSNAHLAGQTARHSKYHPSYDNRIPVSDTLHQQNLTTDVFTTASMQKYARDIDFSEGMQPQYSGAYQLNRSANPHPIQSQRDYGRFPSPQCTPQIVNPVTHRNAPEQLQEFLHQNDLGRPVKQETGMSNFDTFTENPRNVPHFQDNQPNFLRNASTSNFVYPPLHERNAIKPSSFLNQQHVIPENEQIPSHVPVDLWISELLPEAYRRKNSTCNHDVVSSTKPFQNSNT